MTVKELVALGFGGYAGWNDKDADANFKSTGGQGKFTGGVKLDPFIKKWTGKKADFDGQYGGQCVDLIRFYMRDVLGGNGYQLPKITWASEFYTNFKNTKEFIQVPNAAYNAPRKGDIIVYRPWFYPYGRGGHVAIVLSADGKSVTIFEQNFPTGTLCKKNTRGYGLFGKAVLGWLHPIINIV